MAKDIYEISKFLEKVKFKKKFFGGVDEIDVWNKIEKLNKEYKELFVAQQAQIEYLERKLNEERK